MLILWGAPLLVFTLVTANLSLPRLAEDPGISGNLDKCLSAAKDLYQWHSGKFFRDTLGSLYLTCWWSSRWTDAELYAAQNAAERRAAAEAGVSRMRAIHRHAMVRVAAGKGNAAYAAAADYYLARAEVLALSSKGDAEGINETLKRSGNAARRAYDVEFSEMASERIQVGTLLLSALEWSCFCQESDAAAEPVDAARIPVAEAYLARVQALKDLAKRETDRGHNGVGENELKPLAFFRADAEFKLAFLRHDMKNDWVKVAESRRDAAEALYRLYWKEFANHELIYKSSMKWLNATLALQRTNVQKKEAYKAHLERMRKLRSTMEQKNPRGELLGPEKATIFYQAEAEILVSKAQVE